MGVGVELLFLKLKVSLKREVLKSSVDCILHISKVSYIVSFKDSILQDSTPLNFGIQIFATLQSISEKLHLNRNIFPSFAFANTRLAFCFLIVHASARKFWLFSNKIEFIHGQIVCSYFLSSKVCFKGSSFSCYRDCKLERALHKFWCINVSGETCQKSAVKSAQPTVESAETTNLSYKN